MLHTSLSGLVKPQPGARKKSPKVLDRLHNLPARCWKITPNESRGCQYYARAIIGPVIREVMFDSGAGLNTIPEEAVLEVINVCEASGMGLGDPNHPIIQLETWEHREECRGVAGGVTVPLIGAVSLMMTFVDQVTNLRKTVPAKFKILAASRTDWVPIILGGMSIDCVDRGGLGLVTQKMGFHLTALNISVGRLDKYTQGRPDGGVLCSSIRNCSIGHRL